jgi:hypothetical protein
MLHPVAFVALEATGWPESPPAAVGIVKERGGSRQNTLRRVRRAFSEGCKFFVRHHRVAREFLEVLGAGCAWLLFSAG